ncbi:MAG: DUF3052 family protein [Deltaproteobacteria bacterium]|nr:DUF3052 family protein [Deltaproteobacteria bacterium]
MSTGYSGKALCQKLGIVPGGRVRVEGYEGDYEALVGCPVVAGGREAGLVHLFVSREAALREGLAGALPGLPERGMIWVSWPKRASGVATDITEDTIRAVALPMGLVDIKVCAVDATWSGLKLVRRRPG